jgi:hypothetical protein
MKAIHWVATIAASLVLAAVYSVVTIASWSGGVSNGTQANSTETTPDPLPGSVIPAIDDPIVTASHHAGANLTNPKFKLANIQTPLAQDGVDVEAAAEAVDGSLLQADCYLGTNWLDDDIWGWVPDFSWTLVGAVSVNPWTGPSPERPYFVSCTLSIATFSSMTEWEDSDVKPLFLAAEDEGPLGVTAELEVPEIVYFMGPQEMFFRYWVKVSGYATTNRGDGIALNAEGENGPGCGGEIVLYDFTNNKTLATWGLN